MDVVLSHTTALEFWRTAGAETLRAVVPIQELPPDFCPVVPPRDAFPLAVQHIDPIDVLVFDPSKRRGRQQIREHVCQNFYAQNSLFRFDICSGQNINLYTCSPELSLLQASNLQSEERSMICAMELCGTYMHSRESSNTLNRRPALITKDCLHSCCETFSSMRGSAKFRRIIRSIEENSASPMESILHLILCVPRKYGGFGLKHPMLNAAINLSPLAVKIAKRKTCVIDLYWPEFKIGLEYNSHAFHDSEDQIARDVTKEQALKLMDITILPVTSEQISNMYALSEIALWVARHTGKHIRKATPEVLQRRKEFITRLMHVD